MRLSFTEWGSGNPLNGLTIVGSMMRGQHWLGVEL